MMRSAPQMRSAYPRLSFTLIGCCRRGLEIAARKVFHRDEFAAGMESVVVNLHYRTVLHGADGGVLARELAALLGALDGRLADLQSYIAPERNAVGEVHDGARGLAELMQDGVLRQIQMR